MPRVSASWSSNTHLAPYPTLVGTATTGASTSPATTDGSAQSIPATHTTTSALRTLCFVNVSQSCRALPSHPSGALRAPVQLAQQTVQWAAYFAISRLLTNTSSGEYYEEYLTFQALVSSGLASVTALTLCQVKTNAIFHEFTLSLSQKLAHTLASLVNTLAHSTLLVLICTIIFDLIFVIAAKTNFLWALLCLLQLFLLLPAIYLFTIFWGKSVTEENDL